MKSLADEVPETIDLIVDGGSENNNATVSAYLDETPIRKLVARIDVSFSNSMIEAVNKILKYRYLFRTPIPDLGQLHPVIGKSVIDYNDRPHYFHTGLSPNEAHAGKLFNGEGYREALKDARLKRMEANRLSSNPCWPLDLDSEEGSQ